MQNIRWHLAGLQPVVEHDHSSLFEMLSQEHSRVGAGPGALGLRTLPAVQSGEATQVASTICYSIQLVQLTTHPSHLVHCGG